MLNKYKSPTHKDSYFLEGPRSRLSELLFTFKVMFEFIAGFRILHFIGPSVAVFGSARVARDSPYYKQAQELACELAKLGFSIITGGGPGIMEAANKGAQEGGGKSIGCNIKLPMEQMPNPYLDKWFECDYFFTRKVLMFKYSDAFIIMPGGIGTLDEFFEAFTLIQTKKIIDFPIIIFGNSFWEPIKPMLKSLLNHQMISKEDLDLILFTDSVTEAVNHINKIARIKFDERRKKSFKPIKIFGE